MPDTGDAHITRDGHECILGGRIENLEQLDTAAKLKVSVIVPKSSAWNIPRPAIFILNQIGYSLLHMFRSGMFIYVKKPKTKKSTSPS